MALFIHQCDSGGNPNSLSARSLKERARAHMSPLARQPNAEETWAWETQAQVSARGRASWREARSFTSNRDA
jgi:hypothetical protein